MMEKLDLVDLQRRLEDAIHNAFEEPCWIRAEINRLVVSNGHCHMELVQKDKKTDRLLAKAQAVIWASTYALLEPFFKTSTGMNLEAGLQVLLCVEPRMHPLYGLSLVATNIDPSYTVGGLELERKKTMDRLDREGITDMNRDLPFPDVPLHLAVISSKAAAGYQDFADHIKTGGFAFRTVLFPAVMQGEGSPPSIIRAMEKVLEYGMDFDLLILIRGGGAATDLHSYDNYDLAAHIAQFPIPVITGIGHHRDVHIADRVAHLALKTPTAVADFLNAKLAEEEQKVILILRALEKAVHNRTDNEKQALEYLLKDLESHVTWALRRHEHQLELLEQRITNNNPLTLLQKGYSITLAREKALLDVKELSKGQTTTTVLYKGSFESVVETIKKK
ncbi:MAG: exodeoxyribonuclease VII large subunit [Bacteroidales bacterium]|nr:exodeoxyribonuclease VII large subunit [Bacteroidales bacterium]